MTRHQSWKLVGTLKHDSASVLETSRDLEELEIFMKEQGYVADAVHAARSIVGSVAVLDDARCRVQAGRLADLEEGGHQGLQASRPAIVDQAHNLLKVRLQMFIPWVCVCVCGGGGRGGGRESVLFARVWAHVFGFKFKSLAFKPVKKGEASNFEKNCIRGCQPWPALT